LTRFFALPTTTPDVSRCPTTVARNLLRQQNSGPPPQDAAVFCGDEKTAIQADCLDPVLTLSPGRGVDGHANLERPSATGKFQQLCPS
jgi:hypothetical protein